MDGKFWSLDIGRLNFCGWIKVRNFRDKISRLQATLILSSVLFTELDVRASDLLSLPERVSNEPRIVAT